MPAALRLREDYGARDPRPLVRRLAVDQPSRTVRVECRHPVANRLPLYTADLGCRAARGALIDRHQRQQAPSLGLVLHRILILKNDFDRSIT